MQKVVDGFSYGKVALGQEPIVSLRWSELCYCIVHSSLLTAAVLTVAS